MVGNRSSAPAYEPASRWRTWNPPGPEQGKGHPQGGPGL